MLVQLNFLVNNLVHCGTPADKTYNKKVFVLTSHQTGSTPETFALASMAIKNITRVGSHTEGIFSDILEKKLPSG